MTAAFYEQALRRMFRFSVIIGVAGVFVVLAIWGAMIAAGFLLGATLSLVNLRWWISVANSIGASGHTPLRASAVFLVLRYALFGGAIYVIVKILKITPAALLAGLLVTVAAVMVEALYELIYART
jgi:ATP synthase I chain